MKPRKLSPAALDYLKARGIDGRAASKRGLYVTEGKGAEETFGFRRPFLVIPYFTAEGKILLDCRVPFVRGRILSGKGFFAGMPKKGLKFGQPRGTRNHLYFDPGWKSWPKINRDPTQDLFITEGEAKAICATEYGVICIAISGVWSWKTRLNGRSVPLPEFDAIAWTGRKVILAFDSDFSSNPDVMAALHALALELTKRGALVMQIVIPPGTDGAKQGLDDYLVAHCAQGLATLPCVPVALVLKPGAPLEAARAFVGANYKESDGQTLHFYRGAFFRWDSARYVEIDLQVIRSEVCSFLDSALQATNNGNVPFMPNMRKAEDVIYCLRTVTALDASGAPLWLDNRATPDANELVAMNNGLLELAPRNIIPHTPLYFNLCAIEIEYECNAPSPSR